MVAFAKPHRKTHTPDRSAKDSGHRFYSAEISRWLSRDPIGENGGINVYGFVGNNTINAVDPVGLWQIERRGERWASALPEAGDTFRSLAARVGLEYTERILWVRTLGGRRIGHSDEVNPCTSYQIPNTVVLYTLMMREWADNMELSAPYRMVVYARDHATAMEARGFNIVRHENESRREIFVSGWRESGIYGFVYGGHGVLEGGVVVDDFSAPTLRPDATEFTSNPYVQYTRVRPHEVYPPYRLARIVMYGCRTAMDQRPGVGHFSPSPERPRDYSFRDWYDHLSTSPNAYFIGTLRMLTTIDLVTHRTQRLFPVSRGDQLPARND